MSNLARLQPGSNNPPGPIDYAQDVINDVNGWLKDHPTIETEEQAREAKPFIDRVKAALEAIEAERDSKVRPLNEQVATLNAKYKAFHNTDPKKPALFDKVVIEIKARVQAFMIKEEERRRREAEAAAAAAAEAERIAREAEEREREALQGAATGELDVDVVEVTKAADESFAEFERASRFAERAEKNSNVRVGGGFGRVASLRNVETLHLESYNKAIKAIGPHPKIEEAILSAAREYRKTHGVLPDGVTATNERKL